MTRSLITAGLSIGMLGSAAASETFVFLSDRKPVTIRIDLEIDGTPAAQAWDDFVAGVFGDLDRNEDGHLDVKEADAAPSPSTLFGGGQIYRLSPSADGAKAMDLNADGKVTIEELDGHFRHNGGGPVHVRFSPDGGGGMRYFNAGPKGASGVELNNALFGLLDGDGDGSLSADEMSGMSVALLRRDADDDELVTPGEVLGRGQNFGANQFIIVGGGQGSSSSGEGIPLKRTDPSKGDRELAERLLAAYDTPGAGPSGRLTREELGVSAERFSSLDMDEDGMLDSEELARFAHGEPDHTLTANIAEKGSVRWTGPDAPGGETPRFELGNTRLTMAAKDQSGSRFSFGGFDSESLYKMQFSNADQDNNGYLDEAEAKNPPFRGMFGMLDADGDGKIFLKEMTAGLKQLEEIRGNAEKSCITVTIREEGQGLFDELDQDGNGSLSLREFNATGRVLAELDDDKDGSLGRKEVPRRFELTVETGSNASGFTGRFAAVSIVGNGQSSRPTPTKGPVWFRKMDRNGDGDLSPREFLGTREMFGKLDADGDGLIGDVEAEAVEGTPEKDK